MFDKPPLFKSHQLQLHNAFINIQYKADFHNNIAQEFFLMQFNITLFSSVVMSKFREINKLNVKLFVIL